MSEAEGQLWEKQCKNAWKKIALLEESLSTYRRSMDLKIEDAGARTWIVSMPCMVGSPIAPKDNEMTMEAFHGRALEAMEFFVKKAYELGLDRGRVYYDS